MAKKLFSRRSLALLTALVMCFSVLQVAAYGWGWDDDDDDDDDDAGGKGKWSYNFYLCQEYLGNAAGAAVKPDPVGYGFQGVYTSITFTDDAGTTWTFQWNTAQNGDWKASASNVSEAQAQFPSVTYGKIYSGTCGNYTLSFTLGEAAAGWTYRNTSSRYANWCAYIRFIRSYTVNVFYQNKTGSVVYNGETFAADEPYIGTFHFLYPDGGIISDSEHEDADYKDPITLKPDAFLPQSMQELGYEIKYATDASGKDVLTSGVTISLLGQNELNVYCTLKPPATKKFSVVHRYYMDGTLEGSRDGSDIQVPAGSDFDTVVAGIPKQTSYKGNTYTYVSYDVDMACGTITLNYNRTRPTYRYGVTYNANFGSSPATAADSENTGPITSESYTITADACAFSREHYGFAGWNTKPDGSGTAYAPGDSIALTAADNTRTLYAQWQENPKYDYTVTYNANFGANPEIKTDAESVSQVYDTSCSFGIDDNPFAREHYDFAGWATEPDGEVVFLPGCEITFHNGGSEELYAVWKEHCKYDYTVIYNANFGTNPETKADAENVTQVYNTSYTIDVDENPFVREHYTFVGWATAPDGAKVYEPGMDVSFTCGGRVELFALWQENPKYDYTVTYNANFGAAPETKADAENATQVYDTAYRIYADKNPFARANYTFTGWNTQPDGSGKTYLAGNPVNLTSGNPHAVLYAQWQENPKYDYTVTYNANFGEDPATSADAENVSQVYDSTLSITVDANTFLREHYTFVGWAAEADGEVVYLPGDVIPFEKGGSKVLYAVWAEHDKHSYTVTYNGNGGSLTSSADAYGDSENVLNVYDTALDITVDENPFVREHYDFAGWNTEPDGSGTAYSPEQILNLTAARNTMTLYAQWREHPRYDYTVTYNANFGENPETASDFENAADTYETSKIITVDVNRFSRDNYDFLGWAVEPDGDVVYAPGDKLEFHRGGSMELFAAWQITERPYDVLYLVQVDDGPYTPYSGQMPAGGRLPHGTTVGKDIVNPPAQLDDGVHIYQYVGIDEIVLGDGENTVRVYYRYTTPPEPETEPTEPPTEPSTEPPTEPPTEPSTEPSTEPPCTDDSHANVPKTGDPTVLYGSISALSCAGLLWLGFGRKKKEE